MSFPLNDAEAGDANGDQVADFEIVCFGFIDFTTADFVL